jgi:hypothetical protein
VSIIPALCARIHRLFNRQELLPLSPEGSILHSSVILMSMLLVPAGSTAPVQLSQVTIEQRVIIRVPLARQRQMQAEPSVEWQEKKGPKCLAIRSIRGASVAAKNSVDMTLVNGERYRAKLERGCRAVDFWSGFYVEATKDGSLCSGRDMLQARGGTECEIDVWRRLVADDE